MADLDPGASPRSSSGTPARPRGRWRLALTIVALAVVGAAAWAVRRGSTTGAPGRPAGPDPARPVPVVVATATRRDVPVILEGLGTVVANRTVTVRSLVDGRLERVLFQEGQAVKAGQVLAEIDPRPFRIQLAQAEGALARDQAQLTSARQDLERYRSLFSQKLVAQQQVDVQEATVGQLLGTVRMDQAAVDAARLSLDYARITSPVEGVTGLRIVDPGNVVHASDSSGLVLVTQLDPIAVVFTLPQDTLPAVAGAMAAGPLEVEVLGRDGATALGSGRLQVVDNQVNAATSTIRLKATLPNPRRLLWPNQFVKARLHLSVEHGVLVVPATALQRGPSGPFVYVVGPDADAVNRPVEVTSTPGELVVLAHGVAEGERVVVDGQGQLRPGAKVAVREPGQGGPGAAGGGQRPRDGQAPSGGSAATPGGRGGAQERTATP